MAWLDVHYWPDDRNVLVVDCQADLLTFLPSRFSIPLLSDYPGKVLPSLNPVLRFGRRHVTLLPQLATTLTVAELGAPIGSILEHEYVVLRAIDVLTGGV